MIHLSFSFQILKSYGTWNKKWNLAILILFCACLVALLLRKQRETGEERVDFLTHTGARGISPFTLLLRGQHVAQQAMDEEVAAAYSVEQ